MRIRKYTGRDMQEALLKVKMDLGSDAVILSSKKVKKKGIAGWFSKPVMEVLAAIDEADVRQPKAAVGTNRAVQAYKQSAPIDYRDESAAQRETQRLATTTVVPENAQPATEVDALRQKVSNMESMLARIMQAVDPAQAPGTVHQATQAQISVTVPQTDQTLTITPVQPVAQSQPYAPFAAAPQRSGFSMETQDFVSMAAHQESSCPIQSIPQKPSDISPATFANHHISTNKEPTKEAVSTGTKETIASSTDGQPEKRVLSDIRRILVDQEVEEGLADKILAKISEKLPEPLTVETALKACARILLAILGEPETIHLKGSGQTTIAMLIGPTGVGKTTTLAKIAAEFAINQGKRVGLITSDTYRIAAVEQLKTYAEILNVPVKVIYSPEEIKKAIVEFSDRDLILVDTAGRSHRNKPQFDELKTLISSAGADELYLVLSGNTSRSACREILDHYAFIGNYKLLFTKLDEATVPGIILNARFRTGKPLSYTTAGQTVPDDLDVANPRLLVSGIVGKTVVNG